MGGGGRARQIRASSVLLGIPTVPRPKGVDYLEQTLQAVLSQCQAQSQQAAEEVRNEFSSFLLLSNACTDTDSTPSIENLVDSSMFLLLFLLFLLFLPPCVSSVLVVKVVTHY